MGSLCWINAHLTICLVLALLVGTAAEANESARPEVRVAFMWAGLKDAFTTIEFMAQQIRRNGTILPEYDIIIDPYYLGKPGRGLGNGPSTFVKILGDTTPTYHALAGPIQNDDVMDLVRLTAAAYVLNVHSGENPVLSNSNVYPYNFRVVRSAEGKQVTMYFLCFLNGWNSTISIWDLKDMWDSAVPIAQRYSIINHQVLSEVSAPAWAQTAAMDTVMALMRSTRTRVVLIQIHVPPVGGPWICHIHRTRTSGILYFVDANWDPGWFLDSRLISPCTGDEMFVAVRSHLQVYHPTQSPGLDFVADGAVVPPIGGDQSQSPLTCFPGYTADSLFNTDDMLMGKPIRMFPGTKRRLAPVFDAVCASLLALHDAIYNKGITTESIEQREISAFHALVDSMSRLEFQAASGRLRFYNDSSGDPAVNYFAIEQGAVPGRANASRHVIAAATFPNGRDGDPVISTIDENNPFIWQDGSTGIGLKPELGKFPDCGLVNGVLVWDACVPCPAGKRYDAAVTDCRSCFLGRFTNESGMDECQPTTPGSYVNDVDNPTFAARCPLGHECPQVGQVVPHACSPGSYANRTGQDACELCPAGEYQNEPGASSCVSCDVLLRRGITATIASKSPDDCICPQGTFRRIGADHCSTCPGGMECSQGSDELNLAQLRGAYPQAQIGYMSLAPMPMKVYRCKAEAHCPGGPPGSCGSHRDTTSVACGVCNDDSYEDGEKCKRCNAGAFVPRLLLIPAVALVLVVAISIGANRDARKIPLSTFLMIGAASVLIAGFQTMGVFSTLQVPWPEPIKTILDLGKIFSFDLGALQVSCVMGSNAVRSFAFKQALAIAVVPCALLSLLCKNAILRARGQKVVTEIGIELCNAVGSLYSVFFITVLISALSPFVCYKHPGGIGDSVLSAPSILCFDGEDYAAFSTIGAAALLLVPAPFLCACIVAIILYPRMIHSHGSGRFLRATRFLFIRFVPQRYYFQLFMLGRSMVICLIPVILRDETGTQVLFFGVTVGIYIIAVVNLNAWRVHHCNQLEVVIGMALIILLLCGALFLEESPQKDAVAALGGIAITGSGLLAIAAMVYAMYQRFAPDYFQFFICHHKLHAAAQARYLKIILCRGQPGVKVFIDSDNLQELDLLFDIVKSRVRHLLVVLTADTLRRPWCVGEIATARRAGHPVTRLVTPSFVAPTSEQQSSPDKYVDSNGCNLTEHGIEWNEVTQAFSFLLSSEPAELILPDNVPGTRRFEQVAASLLKQQNRSSGTETSQTRIPRGCVLVVTSPLDDEASAAAGILRERIQEDVYSLCEQGIVLLCDYPQDSARALQSVQDARAVVLILSNGCLQSTLYLSIICELTRMQGADVANAPSAISVNIPGFNFPSGAAIDKVCEAKESMAAEVSAVYLIAFFKRLSIFLPTHASQEALNTQSAEVFQRIKQCSSRQFQSSSKGSDRFESPSSQDRENRTSVQSNATRAPSSGASMSQSTRPTILASSSPAVAHVTSADLDNIQPNEGKGTEEPQAVNRKSEWPNGMAPSYTWAVLLD